MTQESLQNGSTVEDADNAFYGVIVSRARTAEGRMLAISVGDNPADYTVYVRNATGSPLQQWERRLIKQNEFALVNRERPDLCIARRDARNGSALILKPVSEAPGNAFCRWRDEGDLRGYHPINSASDWEQKINIPGNGPYRDGSPLVTWEWSKGAVNEMWSDVRAGYDLAAGADTAALNALSAGVYAGTYPKVFQGSISVGKLGIDSVSYDILRAPVFSLTPSRLAVEGFRAGFCNQNAPEEALAAAALEASRATFDGLFEQVTVTINFANGNKLGPISGLVRASAMAQVEINSSLIMRLLNGKIEIPGIDPKVLEALNLAFVPLLIAYLNKSVLDPISIPALEFEGVKFTMPEVVTQPDTLVAFSAVQPSPVAPPPAGSWPKDVIFVGADTLALNEVANAAVGKLKIGDKWEWGCDVGVCDLKLLAEYHLNLGGASFRLKPGTHDRLTGSISFSGGAQFRGKCGIVSLGFGANINGSGTVTAAVIVRDSKVIVIFEELNDIRMSVDITGSIPWPITLILSKLLEAFIPAVAHTVALFLRGKQFDVFTIPTIRFTIAGTGFQVTLRGLRLDTIMGAGLNPLLTVTGMPEVKALQAGPKVEWAAPESESALAEELTGAEA